MFAHFIDEESGAQRGTSEVATELTYGVCDVSRNLVTLPFLDNDWQNRTPHSPCRIQWLGLPRRGLRTGHRKLPQTDLTLAGASPVTMATVNWLPSNPQPSPGVLKRNCGQGRCLFSKLHFSQHVHTVLTKLNMPGPGGCPSIAGS